MYAKVIMQNNVKPKEKIEQIIREFQTDKKRHGMNALLAPELVSLDEEHMAGSLRYRKYEWEQNERGEVHGGIISAMFDTAMGMTVLGYMKSVEISTADLCVSFIRPFLGDSYIVKSEIVHPGRMITRVRATAYDEETGKTLASATSNFVHLK